MRTVTIIREDTGQTLQVPAPADRTEPDVDQVIQTVTTYWPELLPVTLQPATLHQLHYLHDPHAGIYALQVST